MPKTPRTPEQAALSKAMKAFGQTLAGAAHRNDFAKVAALAKTAPDSSWLDARGSFTGTALTEACQAGEVAIVELLLSLGASPETPNEFANTPLMHACQAKDEAASARIVQMLIEAGATLDTRNQIKQTALLWASFGEHEETLKVLLGAGAHPSVQDVDGHSPAHRAAQGGRGAMLIALAGAGADMGLKTKEGLTPAGFARYWGQEDMGALCDAIALAATEAKQLAASTGKKKRPSKPAPRI